MEKTYKFILPQNEEVQSTKVRVENGEVFVDVEFRERFEPKDGDFCVSETGLVFINKKACNGVASSYIGINSIGNMSLISCFYNIKDYARFATPEEKSAFLERLEKECHKRWNPETKQLEDIRWRVEKDGCFFYVSGETFNVLKLYDNRGKVSDLLYKNSNYFKTPEAAQKVAEQIKEIFKTSKTE